MSDYIDIVFDGPPGPNTQGHHCNFVEVETPDGRSVSVGEWIDRGDGLWALRMSAEPPKLDPTERAILTTAKAQLERGDDVTPNIATVLILALIRITEQEPTT